MKTLLLSLMRGQAILMFSLSYQTKQPNENKSESIGVRVRKVVGRGGRGRGEGVHKRITRDGI